MRPGYFAQADRDRARYHRCRTTPPAPAWRCLPASRRCASSQATGGRSLAPRLREAPISTKQLSLGRWQRFPVGAVATHDEGMGAPHVLVLARYDCDHVDAGVEWELLIERKACLVRAVAVGLIVYLARTNEDVHVAHLVEVRHDALDTHLAVTSGQRGRLDLEQRR